MEPTHRRVHARQSATTTFAPTESPVRDGLGPHCHAWPRRCCGDASYCSEHLAGDSRALRRMAWRTLGARLQTSSLEDRSVADADRRWSNGAALRTPESILLPSPAANRPDVRAWRQPLGRMWTGRQSMSTGAAFDRRRTGRRRCRCRRRGFQPQPLLGAGREGANAVATQAGGHAACSPHGRDCAAQCSVEALSQRAPAAAVPRIAVYGRNDSRRRRAQRLMLAAVSTIWAKTGRQLNSLVTQQQPSVILGRRCDCRPLSSSTGRHPHGSCMPTP